MLEQKKKLLRNYTQNVDGIERRMGIENVIECHGTMKDFTCMKCSRRKKLDAVLDDVQQGEVCYCSCGKVMKPNITFFGEMLPPTFLKALEKDISKCDLVLVVGTSLKVGGSAHELLRRLDKRVPQVLINREAVCPPVSISDGFDVTLLGNCDDVFAAICGRLRWDIKCLPSVPSISSGIKTKEEKLSSTKKRKRNEDKVDFDKYSDSDAVIKRRSGRDLKRVSTAMAVVCERQGVCRSTRSLTASTLSIATAIVSEEEEEKSSDSYLVTPTTLSPAEGEEKAAAECKKRKSKKQTVFADIGNLLEIHDTQSKAVGSAKSTGGKRAAAKISQSVFKKLKDRIYSLA